MSGRILAGFLAMLLMILAGAAETTRVVQAEEILKKIELGQPVEYENVTVVGDLNLSGLDLPRVAVKRTVIEKYFAMPDHEVIIISPIRITNSVIVDSLCLNETKLQNVTDFHGTMFKGPVFMIGSRFNQTACFGFSRFNNTISSFFSVFNGIASFDSAWFNGKADFNITQFNDAADFYNAQFNDTAFFNLARFNDTVDFGSARFNDTVNFDHVQFNHHAKFWYAWFNDTANFYDAQFKDTASFHFARFNYVNFWKARFNDAAYFVYAWFNYALFASVNFNGIVYFDYSTFNDTADFAYAQFTHKSWFTDTHIVDLSLENAKFVEEIFFDGAQINGTLSLYRTKYDTLNIRWSSIHDLAYDDTAYHLLTQNFNNLGFADDARECQYSYRCKHREELFRQQKFDSWLFDLLAWASYGYGLRPVRPLGWASLLILIGGLFFFLTGSVARSKESAELAEKSQNDAGASQNKPEDSVSIYEALLLSATYFTSGASSIISATPTEFVPVGRGRYVVVILRLLGWIFFVLFLSSLTRTV
ncbi:MAG: pentapeptide repeat-containing protein [Methanothrix sp.]